MKPTLIALLIVGFVSGCSTLQDVGRQLYGDSAGVEDSTTAKPVKELTPTDQNNTKAGPVKELTPEQKQKALRASVVGEYEFKKDGDTTKFIFLENGIQEWHKNGKKLKEYKWSIVNGQIRVDYHPDAFWVFRINTDKSITLIANVNHEHKLHQDYPKNLQQTFKKIK